MHQAGLKRAGALVVVARILVKERGKHRVSQEVTGASIDKLCSKTFAVSRGTLPVPGIGIIRLLEAGSEADFALLEGKIEAAEREHGADRSVRHAYIDFHRQVIRLAGNPLLAIVGETVLLVLYDRVKAVLSAETTEVGLIMHRQLVNACRNRQVEEARQIMAQDIEILSWRFAEFSAGVRERRKSARQKRKSTGA